MATTPKLLVDGTLLTGSLVTLYTTPTNTLTKVFETRLCNTSTSVSVGIDIHYVALGDSAGPLNQQFAAYGRGLILAPGETVTIGEEQRLPAGYFIQAKADTASVVSIRVSGDEVV